MTPPAAATPPPGDWPGEAASVWLLALGQTLGYACFFYIFAALVLSWEQALGWDKAVLAAGPTLAIVISAGLAPFVGRAVDLGRGGLLLPGGALLGALALLLLAAADRPAVYLVAWAGLGVAQACCLYEVCFAFLIKHFGTAARAAITRVTLVAGLASTLAFPAGAALAAALGWRGAVLVAAAVALVVIVPLHWLGARGLERRGLERRGLERRGEGLRGLTPLPQPQPQSGSTAQSGPLAQPGRLAALRQRGFWALALLFSLLNLNHWMLVSFLLPVLTAQGLTQALAVTAASVIGPAQVLGRLVLMRGEGRLETRRAVQITLGGAVLAAVLLALAGAGPGFALGFAAVQGAAMGVMTILRPVLVAETLGQAGYGAVAGLMSIPTLMASAAAPLLGAVLLQAGGTALLIGTALGLAVAALGLALVFRPAG